MYLSMPKAKTVWPSGLRRWLKAPVRKGVGSNPTAVTLQTDAKAKHTHTDTDTDTDTDTTTHTHTRTHAQPHTTGTENATAAPHATTSGHMV